MYVSIGRKPGERLMGILEGRTETISGEFNPTQSVENTFPTLGRKPG
jgi:hypothetical protein